MPRNEGRIPDACIIRDEHGEFAGFRSVHVTLFGGFSTKRAGHAPWPAGGGRPPTNWKIGRPPHPFDIKEYDIA